MSTKSTTKSKELDMDTKSTKSTAKSKELDMDTKSTKSSIKSKDLKEPRTAKSSEVPEEKKEVPEEKKVESEISIMSIGVEEEESFHTPSPIPVCRCLIDDVSSSEKSEIPARKLHILTTAERTESYLRERRIPELIRFLMTKLLSDAPSKVVVYLDKLLDDCMLYRAGLGLAPVLYERQHLEAVVKSFDPGSRGFLTSGQVRRIFATLGLPQQEPVEERTPTDVVLNELGRVQEKELYLLLTAGTDLGMKSDSLNDSASIKTT